MSSDPETKELETKIFSIGPGGPGFRTLPGQPVDEVVEILERLLDRARQGEIVGIATATVIDRGAGPTLDFDIGYRGSELFNLVAAGQLLQYRLSAHLADGDG